MFVFVPRRQVDPCRRGRTLRDLCLGWRASSALCLSWAISLSSCGADTLGPSPSTGVTSGVGVLSVGRSPDDLLPPEVLMFLSESVRPEYTPADLRAARRVLANEPGWLLPAADGEICLVRVVYPLLSGSGSASLPPTDSQVCESESGVLGGRLVETQSLSATSAQGMTRVVGVVPDGVAKVLVVLAGGATAVVPVQRNAYEVIVRGPVAVRFVRRQDSRVTAHRIELSIFGGRRVAP
jgi:hypothetical protein